MADAKRGKMHASASQLALVLLLIGWKGGANLLSQSHRVESAKPITFRHSNENRSIDTQLRLHGRPGQDGCQSALWDFFGDEFAAMLKTVPQCTWQPSRLALPRNLKVANMCSVDLKRKYSRHTFYFKRGEEELDNLRVPQFHSTPWPPNENLQQLK